MSNTQAEQTGAAQVQAAEFGDTGALMASFGEIVTLMTRSRRYRHTFLAELDWLVGPALASRQFSIAKSRAEDGTTSVPVAAILWASVSPDVDARLSDAGGRPRLRPGEWRSGPIPWLIDTIGDPRAAALLVKRLVEVRFAQTGVKTVVEADGKYTVELLRADTGGDAAKACA